MSENQIQDQTLEEAFKPVLQSENSNESSIESSISKEESEKIAKQKDEIEKYVEKVKQLKALMEKCSPIRELTVCVGDRVSVKVGRYWYVGEVLHVSKLSLILLNNNREVALAIGKISTVAILEDGEYGRKWKELKGSRIWSISD